MIKTINIFKSSVANVDKNLRDILRDENTFAYIIAEKPLVLDPTFVVTDETLPDHRYNEKFVAEKNIPVQPIPVRGGTIVMNKGDIGILFISNDMYTNWHKGAMVNIAEYVMQKSNLKVDIQGNDILIANKKFCGTANGFIGDKRQVSAIFISMNPTTEWLINNICIKKSEHDGFISLHNIVSAGEIVDRLIAYTIKWSKTI